MIRRIIREGNPGEIYSLFFFFVPAFKRRETLLKHRKTARKGCGGMDRKKKYRRFLLLCLCLDAAPVCWLGWRQLDRKVPDEIHVSENEKQEMQKILDNPLLTFEETLEVSGEGSYLLPCRLLGIIPFKNIKGTPSESSSVYVSGDTVGIYMETEGVLVIDTGEILSKDGEAQEPAKDILKPEIILWLLMKKKYPEKKSSWKISGISAGKR